MTEYQTLVIVVDELDRCLPNYAIKILERLHHLFSDLQSTVLVMALDKVQMENAIRQIFGDTTDCNAYLKKFVDFEIKVDVGTVNNNFFKKFDEYISLFDENALEPWPDLYIFISTLFSQIEIRQQEHLVKKMQMIHQLLFCAQPKKDYSFLCFELLMAVLSEKKDTRAIIPLRYTETKTRGGDFGGYVLNVGDNVPRLLSSYVKEHWTYRMGRYQGSDGHGPFYNDALDIPLLLIGYSELTYGENGILCHHPDSNKYAEYIKDFKAIKQLLEIIE